MFVRPPSASAPRETPGGACEATAPYPTARQVSRELFPRRLRPKPGKELAQRQVPRAIVLHDEVDGDQLHRPAAIARLSTALPRQPAGAVARSPRCDRLPIAREIRRRWPAYPEAAETG